jgi:hypothetical protein
MLNIQRLERYAHPLLLERYAHPLLLMQYVTPTAAQRRRIRHKGRSRKTHEHQKGTRCGVCRPDSVKGEMP